MSKITVFKQRLARLFDDNLRTSVWGNVFDWIIIGLIVISSLEVFLSTFRGIAERYSSVLHFIDIFTTVVFTIEVTLRIWTADLIDPKYKGFLGRIRYCLSFYGLIDCLSTYTFYLSLIFPIPATAIKVLRVARLLRVFRYMKAFRLLGKAIVSKKEELSISMAVLCIITVILSCLLYFAEHNAQPEVCENGWRTLIWAFAQYIGDPGKVADFPMVTFWGQFIAAIVGLLGIAIFAVPAGLIGSGFLEVIEARNHQKELDKNILKLHNAFERKQDRFTGYQIMPPFLSIADIQARMRMTENAIFEAVDESRDFRVVNLAATVTVDNNPQDRLAVEHFTVNRIYGCMIDRGSKVTIVSLSNIVDPVIGHFAYYMAKIGGFNYISRETGETRPYRSFFTYSATSPLPGQQEFMKDIETLSAKEGSWVITMLAASGANEPEYPTQIHFCYGGAKGDEGFGAPDLLVHDIPAADKLMGAIETALNGQYGICCDRQRYHSSDRPGIFARHLKNKDSVNSLIIRAAWSITCYNPRRTAISRTIAEEIHRAVKPDKENLSAAELKEKGIGIEDYRY